jgi:hypothetical protein
MATKYYAAVQLSGPCAVYGFGTTPEAALAHARAEGAEGTLLDAVPCTPAAVEHVREHGGRLAQAAG